MSEEIRKNEIPEKELENVSGGYYGEEYAPKCEKCGTRMSFLIRNAEYCYNCPNCGHFVPVPY